MYRKNTSSWLKHWDFILLDVILVELAYFVALVWRNGMEYIITDMIFRGIAVTIGLLDLCIGIFAESYKGILRRGYWKEFRAVVSHTAMITVGIIVYLFAMKISNQYSRLAMFWFPFIAVTILYIGRISLKTYLKGHQGPASGKRAIMLIGAEENWSAMVENFQKNPYSEFRVVGIGIVDRKAADAAEYNGIPVIGGEENIRNWMLSAWVDEVLFSIPREQSFPDQLVDECNVMGITVHLKLALLNENYSRQFVERIEGYTVLSNSINMATPKQLVFKRTMDICGGIVGLILTGIIFVFVAPIIYIKSPGPIFFKQVRVGKNGKKFYIYKFRSMYMDAEERKKELMAQNNIKDGMMFKMDNDPRIIKGIGNIIRDYSLDEFPQFWNVLKGDMSLVGTRPPTVDEWEKYQMHHRTRLAIKPGVTGMWQVSGRSDITDFEEVVRLDTGYIKSWDIGLDIKILLKTVLVVLGKEGSK